MSDVLTIVEMTETFGLDDPSAVGNDHGRIRGQLLQQRDLRLDSTRTILEKCEAEGRDLLASEKRVVDKDGRAIDFVAATIDACGSNVRAAEHARAGIERFVTPDSRSEQRWLPTLAEFRQAQAGVETRTLSTSSTLSPTAQSEFVNAITARSVTLAAGPKLVNIPRGYSSKRIPVGTATATVAQVAEGGTITASDPTLSSITLDPASTGTKGMTLVSNECIDGSTPSALRYVQDDLVAAVAAMMDLNFQTGNGTAPNMRGLVNTTGATSTAIAGAALAIDDILNAFSRMEAANLRPNAIFISPADWWTLVQVKTTTSSKQYAMQGIGGGLAGSVRPELFGCPVFVSGSCDTTKVVVADMREVFVGHQGAIEIAVSEDFSLDTDSTAIRVVARYDIGVARSSAVEIITGT
jgi:HK97 family phage major capsid protein